VSPEARFKVLGVTVTETGEGPGLVIEAAELQPARIEMRRSPGRAIRGKVRNSFDLCWAFRL
jgi:hypothetical protein